MEGAEHASYVKLAENYSVAHFERGRGRKHMRKTSGTVPRCLSVLAGLLLMASTLVFAKSDNDKSDVDKRIENAAKVLDEIMGTPDKAIPDKIMSDAKCLAIVPSMVKIAVGFGGNHGKGVATCRLENGTWSAPAPIAVTGGSFGLQLGGQAIDLVMVIMNDDGMKHLLSSKFKLGADASAAAGPVGREAGADTDWKMKSEVLTYSRARGVFAGVDLNGSAVTQDKDETRILFGKFVPFDEILEGKVRPPESAESLLATLKKYTEPATAREKPGE